MGSFSLPVKELKGKKNLKWDREQWRNLAHQRQKQTESAIEEWHLLGGSEHMHASDIQRKKIFCRGKTQEDENPSLLDGWVFLSLKEFSSTSLELSI